MIRKRREQCVVLLDEGFDSGRVADELTKVGYCIRRFLVEFPEDGAPDQREISIKDPRVILRCYQRGYLLFTLDREMKKTFTEELKQTDIGVVATANNEDGIEVWINAFIKSKAKILRDFKKNQRPYFSVLSRGGNLTTDVIGPGSGINRSNRQQGRDKSLSLSSYLAYVR